MWCIAKGEDAAFLAAMEDILDLYCLPYDVDYPVVCMDEKPYQLLDEVREPIPMKPSRVRKVDAEYLRNETSSIFVFFKLLTGWADAHVRERRTRVDWAEEIHWMLTRIYPTAKKVRSVSDNLNTCHFFTVSGLSFRGGQSSGQTPGNASYPKTWQRLNIAEIQSAFLPDNAYAAAFPLSLL